MRKPLKNNKVSGYRRNRKAGAATPLSRGMVLLIALAGVLFLAISPGHTLRSGSDLAAVGQEVVSTVRANFHDSTRAESWAAGHAGYADTARSHGQFVALTRAALAELATSHTAYYTPDDPEYYGLRAIFRRVHDIEDVGVESIGADIKTDGFVTVVFAGSPAEGAGLRRGDRVLSADGEPFGRVTSFRGHPEQWVALEVQRSADEDPVTLRVKPRTVDPEEEWLEAQRNGTRFIERGGKRIAYAPMYSCAGGLYKDLLKEQIAEHIHAADALIIDFRGGWGGCAPGFVDVFTETPAQLQMITRKGDIIRWDQYWRKPLYLLIDGGTRSGKEVVAYSIKKHGLGVLVGERTAGAVVGGRSFLLQDGSLLYLAVADVTVDGERLEGVGVEPDVHVQGVLQYAGGADPQLEAAIDLAIQD
jgi:carboxyl-terminal processing protease